MQTSTEPYFLPATEPSFVDAGESAIANNQRFRQSQKYSFFRNVIDYLIGNDLTGAYYEFGVHRARTFTMAMSLDCFYAKHGLTQGNLFQKEGGGYFDEYVAFDSFEGFPPNTRASEHPIYVPGHVRTGEDEFIQLLRKYGQNTDRVRVIRGFYSDSLSEDLARSFVNRGSKASFVTIDCNLYESYRDVLRWVDRFLQPGSVLYLDDYNTFRGQNDAGPRRAWLEHCSRSIWEFERFLDVGWCGRSFLVQNRRNT